jgi:hypothetical protein
LNAFYDDRGKVLTTLFIEWESLLRNRAHARVGTVERSQLDSTYSRLLPTILAITEEIDDTKICELVNAAFSQLEQT